MNESLEGQSLTTLNFEVTKESGPTDPSAQRTFRLVMSTTNASPATEITIALRVPTFR